VAASHLFAVAFDTDRWLTPAQAIALETVVLPWAGPEQSDALARAFDRWESVCLDTAMLGAVIGHRSDKYVNRLYWNPHGPTATSDAGYPTGTWLPPRFLNESGRSLLRTRLMFPDDAERALTWADTQLAVWAFASVFEDDAGVSGTLPDGSLDFGVASSPRRASPHAEGELSDEVPTFDRPRCAATWTHDVVGEEGASVQTRRCPLSASKRGLACRVHEALGML